MNKTNFEKKFFFSYNFWSLIDSIKIFFNFHLKKNILLGFATELAQNKFEIKQFIFFETKIKFR
jgi:hypothetical protein